MATIGSAVGLGNIWRFPYVAYANGGGAFLIPYIVAMFTVGIPLLIAEFSVGSLFKKSAPFSIALIDEKKEWIGWLGVFSAFIISIYYAVLMAWCLCYLFHSIGLIWGSDTSYFFFNQFLHLTSSPSIIGRANPQIFFALLFIWTSIYLIIYRGIKSIGKVVAITVPLPTLLLLILVIRGITLPGASLGLNFYLSPHFSKILSPQVWLSAYAQVFFSLSLAQGIMILYASHLKEGSDITNNAFITALADGGTAFLAGFAVFSILGYLAYTRNISMHEIAGGGIGLAFITYPAAISKIPFASLFGVVFFLALLTFGIDSAFSMVESITGAMRDRFGISRKKISFIISLSGFLAGIFFIYGNGLYWIEIIDFSISNFALVLVGLFECILFGFIFGAEKIRAYANFRSEILIGRWFDFMLKFFAPFTLILLLFSSIIQLTTAGYKDYPAWTVQIGLLIVILIIAISLIMGRKWKLEQ